MSDGKPLADDWVVAPGSVTDQHDAGFDQGIHPTVVVRVGDTRTSRGGVGDDVGAGYAVEPPAVQEALLTSRAYQKAAAGLTLLYPGIPLLFMGEEVAVESPFPFHCHGA